MKSYLHALYAYIYQSRAKYNMPVPQSPTTANVISALCLGMLIVSVLLLSYLLVPPFADGIDDLFKSAFGRSSGKTIGRLLILAAVFIIYPIVRRTIGTKARYQERLNAFKQMPEAELKTLARKGGIFMGVTLGSILLPMIIGTLMG